MQARLNALKEFLQLPDAAALAAANKRIANLLRKTTPDQALAVNPASFAHEAEKQLHAAHAASSPSVVAALREREYAQALRLLAGLRGPIDAFFDQVMVMDEDPVLRQNRLALLRAIHSSFAAVADLSRLPG